MYLQLGHPGITQYAQQRFGVHRSETYEMLRIAEIIDERLACRDAFEDGRLSWSALKLITRVASSETETEWLEFAAARSFTELRVEVQDAVKKNRSRPRAGRYGLPNLTVKLTLELTREEQVRLETALEKAAALGEIPVVHVQSATADGRVEGSVDLEGLSGALVRLGLSRTDARARLKHAYGELRRRGEDAGNEEKLLTLALSAR